MNILEKWVDNLSDDTTAHTMLGQQNIHHWVERIMYKKSRAQ